MSGGAGPPRRKLSSPRPSRRRCRAPRSARLSAVGSAAGAKGGLCGVDAGAVAESRRVPGAEGIAVAPSAIVAGEPEKRCVASAEATAGVEGGAARAVRRLNEKEERSTVTLCRYRVDRESGAPHGPGLRAAMRNGRTGPLPFGLERLAR